MSGDTIVLERYADYFVPGRPYLDRIIIRLQTDPEAQIVNVERQETHLLASFTELPNIDRLGKIEDEIKTISRGDYCVMRKTIDNNTDEIKRLRDKLQSRMDREEDKREAADARTSQTIDHFLFLRLPG